MVTSSVGIEENDSPLDYVVLIATLGARVQHRWYPVTHEPLPEVAVGPTLACESLALYDANALHSHTQTRFVTADLPQPLQATCTVLVLRGP